VANHPSAEKRNRQRLRRRERNVAQMSKMRTQVKKVQGDLSDGKKPGKDSLQEAIRLLDKAAQKGIVKRKTASRKISRLTRAAAKQQ